MIVKNLVSDGVTLIALKILHILEVGGILGDECTLLQQVHLVGHPVLAGEIVDFTEQSVLWDVGQRVLDPFLRD